jgi:hypothetical protein
MPAFNASTRSRRDDTPWEYFHVDFSGIAGASEDAFEARRSPPVCCGTLALTTLAE